jgi:hypothetical protein
MCDPKLGSDQLWVAARMLSMDGVTAIISRDMCIATAISLPLFTKRWDPIYWTRSGKE